MLVKRPSVPVIMLLTLVLATLLQAVGALAAPDPGRVAVSSAVRDTFTTQASAEPGAWPMAGANPQRTSWTPEEVRGRLKPLWYKPFEPYISQKVQVIAALDTLYIATSRGLYALDAATGNERWVYPTELPLGHSPTIANGVAYVGGFDRKLHAIDALTGAALWTFEADAGFETNPLVVDGIVYAGNRDGTFYAVFATGPQAGQLVWKHDTGGPILYSAAYHDGAVFFASQDSHAYALSAQTGSVIWKSEKLPGSGFRSWWPVVYRDRVIFSGSNNYRWSGLGPGTLAKLELSEVYPNRATDPRGTLIGLSGTEPGDWTVGTKTVDASRSLSYLSAKPYRQTYHVLDISNGQKRELAPVIWTGTSGAGNRYPPMVGADGVLYQQNSYMSDPWIAGGQVSGWKLGTPFISIVTSDWGAVDEPHAYTGGGNLIYWSVCCDREAGAFDITIPYGGSNREWRYYDYNLPQILPGYQQYRLLLSHGDNNPLVPYRGRLYQHRSNTLIAFGQTSSSPQALPMARTVAAQPDTTSRGLEHMNQQLSREIQLILDAGHLRPGYHSHGMFDLSAEHTCGERLVDYWHEPSDTIYTLVRAMPHLPATMQQSLREYIQQEFTTYSPYRYNHIGWQNGVARELFDLPPEVAADLYRYPTGWVNYTYLSKGGWGINPFAFYAIAEYAEMFGGAETILSSSQQAFWVEFNRQASDQMLLKMPHTHNAYIAGYIGFLKLQELAGAPESNDVRLELDRLLQLRADRFTQNSAYWTSSTTVEQLCLSLRVGDNFMYLVPELADYLRTRIRDRVKGAIGENEAQTPYWFVSFAEEGLGEDYTDPLYNGHAMFMAKALILQEPGQELEKYVDVSGFARGDLFYIQKLVATIENYDIAPPPPNNDPIAANDSITATQGLAATIPVLANDSDADGDTLIVTVTSTPNNGSASINAVANTITYVPNAGYFGPDGFTYTVSDGRGGTATATVTVAVEGVPLVPGDVSCDGLANVTDALFVLQYDVGLRQAADRCPLPSNTLVLAACDRSADASCNVVDALFILQCSIGIANVGCASDTTPLPTASDDDVVVAVHPAPAHAGNDLVISILGTSDAGAIGAAAVEVHYDPAVLQPVGCQPDPNHAFDHSSCNLTYASQASTGILYFNLLAASGVSGESVLANLVFHVKGDEGQVTSVQTSPSVWTERGGSMTADGQTVEIRILPAQDPTAPSTAISLPLIVR